MMGKQIYRRAMNDIVPSQALLNRTSVRMRNIRDIKTKRLLNVVKIGLYGSALLGAFLLLVSLTNEPFKPIDHSAVNESPIETILPTNKYGEIGVTLDASKIRDHIQSYFTPFQASEYTPVRAPYPYFPLEYENLKLESAAIVQVTIQEKDVYREKEAVYNPRASFGTYIYVAKVESVWHGDIDTDQLIPISELAWAIPSEQAEEIEWSFKPYTARSLGELELGEQYVLFLGEQDDKGMYPLAANGFGAFSMTEMQHQIENYTLEQLRSMNETNLRETSAPMRDNLLYRLFAAEAYYEFIEKLDN